MRWLLISSHTLAALYIAGTPLFFVMIHWMRRRRGLGPLDIERNSKLGIDFLTAVPIVILLWNLLIYNLANTDTGRHWSEPSQQIAFADTIAVTGESTIVWALVFSFLRVALEIWHITRN
jgi:hypothetical protein